jgi:hypothetical protein
VQKFLTTIVWAQVNSFAEKLKRAVELFPDVFVKWRKIKVKVSL